MSEPSSPAMTRLTLPGRGSVRRKSSSRLSVSAKTAPRVAFADEPNGSGQVPEAQQERGEREENLQQRVAELEKIQNSLEKEKVELMSHVKSQQADIDKQVASWKVQLLRVEEERDSMLARHSNNQRIDAAIIDLYMQFRDRSGDSNLGVHPLSDMELRADLKMRPPLRLLEMIQSELHALQQFKDEFEGELREERDRQRSRLSAENSRLTENLKTAQLRYEEVSQNLEEAHRQIEELSNEKRVLDQSRESASQALAARNRAHKAELASLKAANKELELANQNLQIRLREKEGLAAQSVSLQSQLAIQASKHQTRLEAVTAANKKQHDEAASQAARYREAISGEKKANAEVRRLRDQLAALEKNAPANRHAQESLGEIRRLKEKLQQEKTKTKTAFQGTRDVRMELQSSQRRVSTLQREVTELREQAVMRSKELEFAVAQNEKVAAGRNRPTFIEEEVNRNHSHIQVYKNLLRQKDKEITNLNHRVTALLDMNTRSNLQRKGAEMEAQELQRGVDTLRKTLATKRAKRPATAPPPRRVLTRPVSAAGSLKNTRLRNRSEAAKLDDEKTSSPMDEVLSWVESTIAAEEVSPAGSSASLDDTDDSDLDPLEALEARERETILYPPGSIRRHRNSRPNSAATTK